MKQNPKFCPYVRKDFNGITHIYDPVYMKNYYICIGVSNSKFRKIMKERINLDFDKENSDGKFYVRKRKGQNVGIIWSKDKSVTFIHECLHAVCWCMRDKDISLTFESEEAFTYLLQFLIKWSLKKG